MTKDRRFGDLFELERISLKIDPVAEYTQIGIRSYGNGIFHRPPVAGADLSKLNYFQVRPDRIIFSNIMAWEGAVAVSGSDELDAVGSQRFLSYRQVSDEVDIHYVNYFFQTKNGMRLLASGSTGTVKRNQVLSPRTIEEFRVPLPSLEEQQRVVAEIDRVYQAISLARVESSKTVIASLVRAAFLGDEPRRPVIEVLTPRREGVPIEPDRDYRAIGIRSFGKGIFSYPRVLGSELSKLRYFRFPPDALALSNIKAWEGAVAVSAEESVECVASSRFLFYVPRRVGEVDVRYVRYYLLSEQGLGSLGRASPGSADRNRTLSAVSFGHMQVPVPEFVRQKEIADRLDLAFVHLAAAYRKRKLLAEALRSSALNAAFSGTV